ncbi:MAG: topoisomerase DNA-binding C4 zinc finger domain-containing protein, partial [Acetobacteraceae bacterium]|nr:topoisomerase DNA-binding C4 zinc finger domain-containing protein [Acetobacteraceae bacterium]
PDGRKVNVDHIQPRKTHPQFALTYANLQVLCTACNRGKGNRDRTDWRYRAPTIPTCPACRAPMQRRVGPHGPFWGCSRFPACRATRPENYLAAAAQPPQRQQRARSAVTTRREVLAHNRRRYARIVHKHRRARRRRMTGTTVTRSAQLQLSPTRRGRSRRPPYGRYRQRQGRFCAGGPPNWDCSQSLCDNLPCAAAEIPGPPFASACAQPSRRDRH